MNINYDVTGLLTVVWRSRSGQIVWAAWIVQGGGGLWTHSTYVISRSLPVADNWIDEDEPNMKSVMEQPRLPDDEIEVTAGPHDHGTGVEGSAVSRREQRDFVGVETADQSDLDNRCAIQLYEREGVRATWILIIPSPVYWLKWGGHTQVRLFGLLELAREKGGYELIAHIHDT